MCGIVGYVGPKQAKPILMQGLKRLEYRGYDSAGIAMLTDSGLMVAKEAGKIINLEKKLGTDDYNCNHGIAHTRWATHGEPSQRNSHPHISCDKIVLVHNGIIENYLSLKKKLEKQGITFRSETDTEVLAQMIGFNFDGSLNEAVRKKGISYHRFRVKHQPWAKFSNAEMATRAMPKMRMAWGQL